jgi:hypothetical protein
MDPYLQSKELWPSFQHALVVRLHETLQTGLTERYQTRVQERRYSSKGEQREEYIEIRSRSDGQLVTLLDVLSPANKMTAIGRGAYLSTRQQAKAEGASLVEMDLVLEGQPTLNYSRDGLPPWDYAVTVTRSTQPERYEIYTATLQKRLPRFRVPLAADDRDTVLDLQAAFTRCYDQGGFIGRIKYREAPAVPFSEENRRRIDDFLRSQQLPGQPTLPAETGQPGTAPGDSLHERIAMAAYHLWLQEGCPHGRDQEHWYRAEEQLKRQAGGG